MIDVKILRQQVELGASPARIVDMVEQMLADELTEVDRQLLRASIAEAEAKESCND